MAEKHRCSATVYGQGVIGGYLCSREGTVQADGKWWCHQHSPAAKATREAKWEASFDARRAERERQDRISDAERDYRDAAVAWAEHRLTDGALCADAKPWWDKDRALLNAFDALQAALDAAKKGGAQ